MYSTADGRAVFHMRIHAAVLSLHNTMNGTHGIVTIDRDTSVKVSGS